MRGHQGVVFLHRQHVLNQHLTELERQKAKEGSSPLDRFPLTPSRVINVGERKENDPNRVMWSLGLQMSPLPAAAPRWFGHLARMLLTPV